jgi:predicted ester cyclase
MSDFKVRFLTVMAMGNQIVFEQLIRAKHTGPFVTPEGEIPATGRSVKFKSVWFAKINKDGLIVEDRTYFDTASFLKQLGLED